MPLQTITFGTIPLPAGTRTLGPWTVPDKWQRITLTFDALALGVGMVTLAFEFSEDAGATWQPIGGATMRGGLGRADKVGGTTGNRSVSLVLPAPNGKPGLVRGQISLTVGYTCTGGTLEILT